MMKTNPSLMAPTSVKFPAEMKQKAVLVAKKYGLSFNAFVRLVLARELERIETRAA